jgi:site-specific DNA-methyltransferase (adenine-specific)
VQKPYGFRTDIFNNPKTKEKYKIHPNHQENDYKIYGVGGHKGAEGRKVEFVNKKYISIDVLRNKDKYKLFFSKAFTYKYPYNSFPKIIIAGPQEICSETFLAIGCFDTKTLAENCLSFIKTRL